MSLGPNAYDQQFRDRIDQIRQGGGQGPTPPSGGGGKGGGGAIAAVLIIIVLAVLRGATSPRPSIHTPPPQIHLPQFEMPKVEIPKVPDFHQNQELERLLREMREQKPLVPPGGGALDDPELRKLLEDLRKENPPRIDDPDD